MKFADRKYLMLHIIDEYNVGGAQTHLLTMVKMAIGQFDIVHVVLALFGPGPLRIEFEKLGIRAVFIDIREQINKYKWLAAWKCVVKTIRKIRPDFVEAHLTYSRLLGLSAAWSLKVPKRIGFEQGDIYFNGFKWRLANFIGQLFAQKIIVCSEWLNNWAHQTHCISRKKLVTYHNSFDETRFCLDLYSKKDARNELGFDENQFVFCSVGSLGTGVNKRVDISIKALCKARKADENLALVICGDGNQRPALEELTRQLRIEDFVKFIGLRKDVPHVMAGCDAFCHAAPNEPFGIVAVEAMAMKLPALVPASGGIKEIIREGKNGYVYKPLDSDDLANKMVLISQNQEKYAKMQNYAYEYANSNHTTEQYLKKIFKMYGLEHFIVG